MPAPVFVCAIITVAAVIAFYEFVYEPHIAPTVEGLAEDFLANRRAKRQAQHPVPALVTRGSGHGDPGPSGADTKKRSLAREEDSVELQGYNLDEWLNQVHRTTQGTSMRRRVRVIPDTDEGSTLTTIDESFPSLTHTPLTSTHVISNVSSPFTEALSVSTHTPTPTPLLIARTDSDNGSEGSWRRLSALKFIQSHDLIHRDIQKTSYFTPLLIGAYD